MRVSQRTPPRLQQLQELQELATELTKRTRSPIALQFECSKRFRSAIEASDAPVAPAVDVRTLQAAHLLSHRGELDLAVSWARLGHTMKPTGEHNMLFFDIPRRQFFAQPLGPDGKDLKGPFPLTPDLMRALEKDMTLDLERAKASLRYGDD